MPVRATELGELLALLLTVSVPLRAPSVVGENVTVTMHLDLGPSVVPHPLTIAKSPLAAMLENVTGVLLLLFRIVTCFGLPMAPLPNTTLPSLSLLGETFSTAGTTVAVGVAVAVEVEVAVAVGVAVAVATGVLTGEGVAVGVAVAVEVGVAVLLAV
jgi:hypothetical protein